MLHFIEKSLDRLDQLHLGRYQEFDQYLTLVMINNMAEECGEFEIVVNVKAKLEIRQHCELVKVKDEVSKTKIACRHCQIELKYSGNISNFSDNLTRKHSGHFSPFFVTSIFSFFHNQCCAVNRNHRHKFCRLFNSNAGFFFLKLSTEIVDYFIPRNKEDSLLNLPGSDISLT